ncbi:MAG: proline--tRNA ligase, partial [Mycoplasmataceae bacterium]|nr:proline--tRNA ligase [Mycoplasmataceae bacterium]
EKFAGAVSTYTIEAMMKDGKALQSGTSHYLGQNFSKAMNIKFQNKDNKQELAYQSSWGISTRLIGAMMMTHGDDRGVIMPPMIASTQIDILEIFGHKNERVRTVANEICKKLSKKYKVRLDSTNKGPGFKSGKSEIEGTPLRIEVGPRDLENDVVTFVRRDTLEKIQVKLADVKTTVPKILKDIQANLLKVAKERLDNNIVQLDTYDEMKEALEKKKFVLVPFAGKAKEEKKIKKETFATTRCIPFKWKLKEEKTCIITGVKTKRLVMFAKAY